MHSNISQCMYIRKINLATWIWYLIVWNLANSSIVQNCNWTFSVPYFKNCPSTRALSIYFQTCPFLRCCATVHFHATKYYSHHISTTNRHLIKVTRIISGHTFSCIGIPNISLLQALLKHFLLAWKTNVRLAIIDHMYYYIGYNYIDSRLETSRKDHTVN